MDPERLRVLLQSVRKGELEPEAALGELSRLPFEDLGFARIDHHRHLRCGMPEVVFGEGKTPEQIAPIAERILAAHGRVLVTRVGPEKAEQVCALLPRLSFDAVARTLTAVERPRAPLDGRVVIVTAGTSDRPVAAEAASTLAVAGAEAECLDDVGVAGLHRLLEELPRLRAAEVLIVVAGMEGALPSVVGGLMERPVIAVPTSIGYGAALSGFTALFGMLTSCASGVTVVNIDNGFGAAMAALRILRSRPRNDKDG
jgi:pyridinium-3,5-biscarboxylic acid mononucleotide synthase